VNFDYVGAAQVFASRILALIPTHPEIITMTNTLDLFKVEGLQINDLSLSLAQASWALGRAKLVHSGEVAEVWS
jgi:hypothetical protein